MLRLGRISAIALLALPWLASCGRTAVRVPELGDGGGNGEVELCDGLDDDGDRRVDEDFLDALGNYLHDEHCGACGRACEMPIANAAEVGCMLREGVPVCAATACASGFGPAHGAGCAPLDDHLCLPCIDDAACGTLAAARCVEIAGERRCSRECGDGCPEGYVCSGGESCLPAPGSCRCEDATLDFAVACVLSEAAGGCPGSARCEGGDQTVCRPPVESCDGTDNDCDQRVDETFVDAIGSYSVDAEHCGACGVDCTVDPEVDLGCGGDPFAPSCVTRCPDLDDGVQPGDLLDADRVLANGCECAVRSLTDGGGAPAGGGELDENCDGADGGVLSSFYVATSGDDAAPGSPTRPLRSIGAAVERARESLRTRQPRPHVFVASGVYTETVRMRDGVQLHGGYRGDFLAQDAEGFEVIVIAPADSSEFGGAALVIEEPIRQPTLVEGLHVRGRDASEPGAPAIGMVIRGASGSLVLRDLRVRAGRPGAGQNGQDGAAGSAPTGAATDGAPPRAALENSTHLCLASSENRVLGGAAGSGRCAGTNVSGGEGGSPECPVSGGTAPSGANGHGGSGLAGEGGLGGDDVLGPIQGGASCPSGVCCGLADFSVPSPFQQAQPGRPGSDGLAGAAGTGCSDSLGTLDVPSFQPGAAGDGSNGAPGRGGGGGGGGGGARMTWFDGQCEFADGLGGGGGGGGAGGCGGEGGSAGRSGGPSIAIYIQAEIIERLPVLQGVEAMSSDGAPGGDGGAGGDGAAGGQGGFGGNVPEVQRSTPTLAGPMSGERGGKGGDGGGGGGGGGGCGGSSIGVWVSGLGDMPAVGTGLRIGNTFVPGAGGPAGRGGGGWTMAQDGAAGLSEEVVVR
jgi:hypothetical protein